MTAPAKRAIDDEEPAAAAAAQTKPPPQKKVRMERKEQQECQICFESRAEGFNCPATECGIWTCYSCFRKSLNDYGIMCMGCSTPVQENRWYDLFPSSFVNKHIHAKASVELFNRFQAQLPGVQTAAEHEHKARSLRENTDSLLDEHVKLQEEIRKLKRRSDTINRERDVLLREVRHLEQLRDHALLPATPGAGGAVDQPAVVVRTIKCFTAGCPAFLDADMNCNICGHTYCDTCQELTHPGTPCDAARVANVVYIRRNTTPCPTCKTPIQRTDGCDQMFCVVPGCNTFFSNRTGKKITSGPLHNPHYLDALRAGTEIPFGADEPAANGCDGLPHLSRFIRSFGSNWVSRNPEESSIMRFHRSISHILGHLPEPGVLDRKDAHVNGISMIDYLLGSKNRNRADCRQKLEPYLKNDFVRSLKKVWKQHNRKEEENTILRTGCAVASDLLRHAMVDGANQTVTDVYKALCYFVEITNAELTRVAESFGNVPTGLFIANPGSKHHLNYTEHRYLAQRLAE
jgi:hypothetical protein